MLRNLQIRPNKPVETTYKASEAMITGMGVVKSYADHTIALPTAETADNIFMLDKEKIPTGINAGRGELSDYETEFVSVKSGEFAKIHTFDVGERRAVDQYVATGLAKGDYMAVGTDGKWKKAAANTTAEKTDGTLSAYVYDGTHTSDGHTLAIIEKIGTAGRNPFAG